MRSGLSLEIGAFKPSRDFALRATYLQSSPFPLRLLFFLGGCSKSVIQTPTATIESDLLPKHNLLTLSAESTVTVEYLSSHAIQSVGIGIEPWILEDFFSDSPTTLPSELHQFIQGHWEQPYSQWGTTTPMMQMTLHQILTCPFQGSIRQMYMDSKAIELITLKLSQIQELSQPSGKRLSLKSADIERIHLAKELLLRDIEHPPSLAVLSKLSGLNDYKLKQGFRQVFGTTVFGYLRSHRMEQARQLLTEQRMTVSEVARLVGYSSLSRFSLAFKEQFGVSPGYCLGRRGT